MAERRFHPPHLSGNADVWTGQREQELSVSNETVPINGHRPCEWAHQNRYWIHSKKLTHSFHVSKAEQIRFTLHTQWTEPQSMTKRQIHHRRIVRWRGVELERSTRPPNGLLTHNEPLDFGVLPCIGGGRRFGGSCLERSSPLFRAASSALSCQYPSGALSSGITYDSNGGQPLLARSSWTRLCISCFSRSRGTPR